MHYHVALSFPSSPSPNAALLNPRFPYSSGRNTASSCFYSPPPSKSTGIQIHSPPPPPPPPPPRLNSLACANAAPEDDTVLKSLRVKDIDVATLGNLCVDIVLNVPKLPPKSIDERRAYMHELMKSPPDKKYWEAGGNCNMAIAAARLGLRVHTIGYVGGEIYGRFLLDVLHNEGIGMVKMNEQNDVNDTLSTAHETLLCWVLVDPVHRHDFCGPIDFNEKPAFSWIHVLSTEVKMAIRRSKIIFCNGYGFDEFSSHLLVSALEYAIEVGTSIFFDPGPRGKSLICGTPEEQMALDKYLRMSDVLLLTSEEAESLTGIADPILAGQKLLRNGIRTKWVIIKMGPKGSILITPSSISCAPAFKVNVVDTVGCGDSFVAAIAFGFLHKMPLVNTITVANAVGAATAMGCGAGRNVASFNKVMELMRGSNLNEDHKFWEDLLRTHLDTEEIAILTDALGKGDNSGLQCTSLKTVACDLLPKLACARALQVGAS